MTEAAPSDHRAVPIRRVVMLGYMCSGKSTVGEALARRLEWDFVDFDVEIERRDGRAVREIIEAEGEEAFRAREAALTDEAAHAAGLVLSPGGGWITRPELLASLGADTLAVWLRISPVETVRRLNADPIDRPLKGEPDAVETVAGMLAEREGLYRLADLSIPGERRTAEQIAFELEQVVRARAAIRVRATD